MNTKLLEIRDRATFIPVVAVEMASDEPAEEWLLSRSGYPEPWRGPTMILLAKLESGFATYDPFGWPGPSRTMRDAHLAIRRRWNELRSGDVVDVEYERGETPAPKRSERETHPTGPRPPLPSLDEPIGETCPRCSEPIRVAGFCGRCERYLGRIR